MGADSMDSMGWIEIIFVGVVALGFGFWQLWSVNRDIAKDKREEESGISDCD